MSQSSFQIRHGIYHDLDGRPQNFGDVTFVPAKVSLHGVSFEGSYPLQGFAEKVGLQEIIACEGSDAPWVLGRLKFLFGTVNPSEEERGEKTFVFAGFLAVFTNEGNLAIPFECSDCYGDTALVFSSEDVPSADLQIRIAKNFWHLLLANPTDVWDYKDRIYHSGAGLFFRFGVSNGIPFIEGEE